MPPRQHLVVERAAFVLVQERLVERAACLRVNVLLSEQRALANNVGGGAETEEAREGGEERVGREIRQEVRR